MGESSFSSSSLRANDMIIAVNGKTIGGMTVATLEIELETGGTKLNLLVSRFKPADRVKQRLQDLEARFIAAFDNDVNNENLLHWVDLGARSISGLKNSSHATVTQKAPVHVSHEREDKETTGANDHDRVAADEDDTSRASSMENNTNSMQQGSPRIAAVETRVYEDHWGQIETTPEKDDSIEPQAQFEAHSAQFEAVDETYEDTSLERSNAPSISHGVEGQHDDQGLYTKHIRFSNEVGSVRPTAPWESVNEGNASTTSDDETGEEIPIENASGDKFLRVAAESSSPLSSRSSVSTCRGSPPKAGSDEDFEDDGNAWCGCVCGVIHGDKDEHEVFWVQCEGCKSWFNVYTGCVHFDQANAQYVKDWHCWGCEEVSTDSQNELSADGLQNELEPNVIEESPTDGACMAGASVQEKNARKLASSVHSPSLDEHTGSNDSSPSRAGHLSTSPASKKAKNAPLSSRFRPDGSITPRSTPTLNRDGTYKKPRGLPPNGYHWDVDSGLWVVDQKTRQHVDAEPTTPSRRPSNDDSHDKKRMTEPEDTASGTDESLVESCVVFKVGELVEIREHAWAGVNNPAGAAYVKDVYRNQGGKLLYDIKYVVGQSTKGVFASYVKAHSFL